MEEAKPKNPYAGSGKAPKATNINDSATAKLPICNGSNRGECEAGTLAQKKEGPAEIVKVIDASGNPTDVKIQTEEQKGKGIVKATNRNDDAPAKKPICNGRNTGECEAGTLA